MAMNNEDEIIIGLNMDYKMSGIKG